MMMGGALKALGVVAFCPDEEWAGKGLKEEALPEVWFLLSTIAIKRENLGEKKAKEKVEQERER